MPTSGRRNTGRSGRAPSLYTCFGVTALAFIAALEYPFRNDLVVGNCLERNLLANPSALVAVETKRMNALIQYRVTQGLAVSVRKPNAKLSPIQFDVEHLGHAVSVAHLGTQNQAAAPSNGAAHFHRAAGGMASATRSLKSPDQFDGRRPFSSLITTTEESVQGKDQRMIRNRTSFAAGGRGVCRARGIFTSRRNHS